MSAIATASHLFHEPRWLEAKCLRWQLPFDHRNWLLNPGSLTARLLKASNNRLQVKILRQQLLCPYLSEARLLDVPPKQLALIREVILCGHGQAWVFARSILPLTTLTGRLRAMRHLDNRPLGALLFKDPSMHRGTIEVAKISPHHHYLPKALQGNATLWGRRSTFYLDNKPLMVSEVFLDSFTPLYGFAPDDDRQ